MQFRKASYVSLVLIAVASFATSILCAMNVNGDARLFKTKLNISFKNNVFEYNGKNVKEDSINYEFLDSELAFNDKLQVTLNEEIKTAGNYDRNSFSYKIINTSGIDVTSSYDISESFENIVISKRKIYFRSGDGAFTYDAQTHSVEGVFISGGSLVSGEQFYCSNFHYFTTPGVYENKFDVFIKNMDTGLATTENYDIVKEYGVIIVAAKGE